MNSGSAFASAQPSAYRWAPAAVLGALALHAWYFKNGADLAVFEAAGRRALHGELFYRLEEPMPFKYAPITAYFFAPFALLPHRISHLIWNALSVAALVRLLRPRLWPLVLALHVLFIHRLFSLGQIDALLLWLMVCSEERAGQPLLSGALWALACLFKPPFLVFALAAGARKQWRRIGALAVFALVGLALSWPQLHAWRELLATTTAPMLCGDPENQGIAGIACHYFGSVWITFPLAIVIAALLFYKRRWVESCFFLSAFFSPLCWETNLIALIPLASFAPLWTLAAAALAVNALNYDLLGRELFFRVLEYRPFGLASLAVALSASRPPR